MRASAAPHPDAGHPAPAGGAVTPAALWFGLFGAPAMWSLQLLASYALVAHGCYPDAQPMTLPVMPGLRPLVLGVAVVALAVALTAGGLAWRSWRATRHEGEGVGERNGEPEVALEVGGRTQFMALAGMLLSAVFVLGIVMNIVPVLLLRPCG
jgi:hypothetical protein